MMQNEVKTNQIYCNLTRKKATTCDTDRTDMLHSNIDLHKPRKVLFKQTQKEMCLSNVQ